MWRYTKTSPCVSFDEEYYYYLGQGYLQLRLGGGREYLHLEHVGRGVRGLEGGGSFILGRLGERSKLSGGGGVNLRFEQVGERSQLLLSRLGQGERIHPLWAGWGESSTTALDRLGKTTSTLSRLVGGVLL
jgi:hypothetical protein